MWMARLADEDCPQIDRDAFDAWMASAPSHRIAAERMGAIAGRVETRDPAQRVALARMLERPGAARPLIMLLVAGGAIALGWWGAHDPGVRARIADERTASGVQRRVELASGDSVMLDGGTALDVDASTRQVRLWRGAVMAQVVHGRTEPFLIRTPQGSARAMGTRYSVRIVGHHTIVTVIVSRVEACAALGDRRCIRLDPGQSARLDAQGATPLPAVDTLAADAWSHGMLYADDRALASVVEELNRYRAAPIVLDPTVRTLRLSGSIPLTDADRALASIAAALPVTIEHRPDGVLLRLRKKD